MCVLTKGIARRTIEASAAAAFYWLALVVCRTRLDLCVYVCKCVCPAPRRDAYGMTRDKEVRVKGESVIDCTEGCFCPRHGDSVRHTDVLLSPSLFILPAGGGDLRANPKVLPLRELAPLGGEALVGMLN